MRPFFLSLSLLLITVSGTPYASRHHISAESVTENNRLQAHCYPRVPVRRENLSCTALINHAQHMHEEFQDYEVAWYLTERAYSRYKSPLAAFNLGVMLDCQQGPKEPPHDASTYYLVAALRGYAPAQFNLAHIYVKRATDETLSADAQRENLNHALYWYGVAARADMPEAAFNVALLYEDNPHIKDSAAKALRYYLHAVSLGDQEALTYIAAILPPK